MFVLHGVIPVHESIFIVGILDSYTLLELGIHRLYTATRFK
jgi:hypothetical protein